MTNFERLHSEAMELLDEADEARRSGFSEDRFRLLHAALRIEMECAKLIAWEFELEPSRSLVFQSAINIALELGELEKVGMLSSMALAGNPFEPFYSFFLETSENQKFSKSLSSLGIDLHEDDIDLKLDGSNVGYGYVSAKDLFHRLRLLKSMISRQIDRIRNVSINDAVRQSQKKADLNDIYLSAFAPGSFSLRARISTSRQPDLFDGDIVRTAISNTITLLDLLSNSEMDAIVNEIPEPDYRSNFISLARSFAPDGERIRSIAVASRLSGERKVMHFVKTKSELFRPQADPSKPKKENNLSKQFTIAGKLLLANSKVKDFGQIEIVDDFGFTHKIKARSDLMVDIVRPLYEERVIATVEQNGKKNRLIDIAGDA